jgi:hypothetical protein
MLPEGVARMGIFDRIENEKIAHQNEKMQVTRVTEVTAPESLGKIGSEKGNTKVTEVTGVGSQGNAGPGTCTEAEQALGEIYQSLTRSGLTDADLRNLDAALFLFAWAAVRDCADVDFEGVCVLYVPFWRKRQHPIAWRILATTIKQRLDRQKTSTAGPIQRTVAQHQGDNDGVV